MQDEIYTLSLPKDLGDKFLDAVSGGLLICTYDRETKKEEILQTFNHRSGFGHKEIVESGGMLQGKKTLSVTYNIKSDSPHVLSRVVVNDVFLSRYMSDPTYENYDNTLKEFQDFDHLGLIEINDVEEKMIQWKVVTLAMGFILYKQALSDRIVSGLPEGFFKKDLETVVINNRHHKTVKFPEVVSSTSDEKNYHLRMGHYRQLRDPKYYKKPEFKHMKVGSRIISVAPSLVGRELNNKTVK